MNYTSRQHTINHPTTVVYQALSRFSNFTPILADKVEGWQATDDTCSFKAQGLTVALAMVERIENERIKIAPTADGGVPFEFAFLVQLNEAASGQTDLTVVLEAHMTMMIKMMVGSKLQETVDKIAEQIAHSFNTIRP